MGGSTPIAGGGGETSVTACSSPPSHEWVERFPGDPGMDSSNEEEEPDPQGTVPCAASSATEDPGTPVTIETRNWARDRSQGDLSSLYFRILWSLYDDPDIFLQILHLL